MFSADELERISTSCRGYLLQLEQEGILSPLQREIVIDRLVALDGDDVDIDRLKWLVLMVLSSQPGQEAGLRAHGRPAVRRNGFACPTDG